MTDRDRATIERSDMNKFPREVQDLVLHLVNTEGVKCRSIDSLHLLLYPPDGTGRPFKVSSSRPAEQQNRYIERQFMLVHGIKGPDGTVPYAKEEAEVATGTTIETPVVVRTDGDPAEAVRVLAAALGVSLGGTVTEEDYLAVVAEKDACRARAQALEDECAALRADNEAFTQTMVDMSRQRDALLDAVNSAFETLEMARS